MVRLTLTSVFVWTQPEAISTSAMIGAVCVNTLVCTVAIAWLTLVDILKGNIRQDKVNRIMNEPFAHSIILQKPNCIVLTQISPNFILIFSISSLIQLMAFCQ